MQKFMFGVLLFFVLFTTVACGPPKTDKVVEIKPHETAFVVPLEGKTGKQGKFMSVDYLEKNKVAAKRIYLPLTKIKTGRWWWNFKWVPTVSVISVNRKPVTFVWGTKDGVHVESKDSIGFIVGIDITAHVEEADTAKFLYHFPSGDLSKTINSVIKSKATEILSREFAKYDLEGGWEGKGNLRKKIPGARQEKGDIVERAKKELIVFFKNRGITIDTFGLIGGLEYEDKEIQQAINDNFKSELEIKNRDNERLAQAKINEKKIAMAEAEKQAAFKFKEAAEARTQMVNLEINRMNAEANLERAKRWNGQLPANIMPTGSGYLMNIK